MSLREQAAAVTFCEILALAFGLAGHRQGKSKMVTLDIISRKRTAIDEH